MLLSNAFYDHLGEQIANELVDGFKQVGVTYRADPERLRWMFLLWIGTVGPLLLAYFA